MSLNRSRHAIFKPPNALNLSRTHAEKDARESDFIDSPLPALVSGPIPFDVLSLTSLGELWLNDNALTGTIPPIDRLGDLRVLRLGGNAFRGCVPRDVAQRCDDGALDCASAEPLDDFPYYRLTNATVFDQSCGVLWMCGEKAGSALCSAPRP